MIIWQLSIACSWIAILRKKSIQKVLWLLQNSMGWSAHVHACYLLMYYFQALKCDQWTKRCLLLLCGFLPLTSRRNTKNNARQNVLMEVYTELCDGCQHKHNLKLLFAPPTHLLSTGTPLLYLSTYSVSCESQYPLHIFSDDIFI